MTFVTPAVAVGAMTTVNAVATNSEASQIAAYGQRVSVDGREMNVVVSGDHEQTIVMLPGLGTAAPGLDFGPLIDQFDDDYRVIAVEPFGTGLSDGTDAPRTSENISREVHEALQQLGVRQYVLMGHSIAGIYALTYASLFPHEVTAFVGIDNSVPDQPGSDEPIPTDAMVLLNDLGITRALQAISPDPYEGLPYGEQTKQQLRMLAARNTTASTMVDEMQRASRNFQDASGARFPASLPVLLFARENDTDVAGWVALHDRQAASVDRGELVVMAGDHYLHHTLSAQIAAETKRFLDG
ncbi:alpha/beta fold hydrolase [Microbacterium sp. SORGH_AS_0862]|uniref:alpha/beta fold hydrolase n=1 Tax=Microbacterium sp. SORGH_AS_0862 TaxID=3041789 RepID=UPI0027910486|nr:alpha/beta hydrolase [Microbacterium sp. SORGH_AS_0862]MDQ1204834.1 pimeloyl-ACP methyl ester carboxylesterase [Microbacterium sp. SORGH_AS_0862]